MKNPRRAYKVTDILLVEQSAHLALKLVDYVHVMSKGHQRFSRDKVAGTRSTPFSVRRISRPHSEQWSCPPNGQIGYTTAQSTAYRPDQCLIASGLRHTDCQFGNITEFDRKTGNRCTAWSIKCGHTPVRREGPIRASEITSHNCD